ncbi:ATP-binding protein [Nocardioides taihuensis]|uniref:ATP-binding protein n=1 Tax=Nocardioides taihuensis TaxID=1835606 RepID=A0ABW0BQ96_9ACTN
MSVEIRLLGGFEVVVDGSPVAPSAWQRRAAADLVKLLVLAEGRRLLRDRVVEALWPDVGPDANPRLHKAAHYARRAIGHPDAVVVRGDVVTLLPDEGARTDIADFEALATTARDRGDVASAERALAAYGGDLLPDDLYQAWTEHERERLAGLRVELLRQARRWRDLLAADPADEAAHLEVMREHLGRGDRMAALRQFERLDRVLRQELGVTPGPAAIALRDRALALTSATDVTPLVDTDDTDDLVGRGRESAALADLLDRAAHGTSCAALVSGPPGSGKSVLLERTIDLAAARGWRTGRGSASRIDGAWPYAPVLEAVADLCRQHPALLDGLADEHRAEIERALVVREVGDPGGGGHQRLFVASTELLRLAAAGEGALIVVDDAHDCDEASLRLLHHIARSCGGTRLAVLLAYRPSQATAALSDVRSSLIERRNAVEISLSALDEEEVRDLVERYVRSPSAELLSSIGVLSRGQPFAVVELARRAADAPDDLRPLMTVLIEQLPRPVRDVLTRVAVAGTGFDTDEFVALSGLDEATAYDRLDEALAAHAIVRDAAGYRFRHPLLREALLEQLPAHRRRLLHRDAARRLEDLGASPARVAHHLVAAGDSTGAAPHLLRAARAEAAVGAYRDALALLDAADRPPAEIAGELHLLRADILTRLGDPRAVESYRQALATTSGPLLKRARTGLARAATAAGDLDTAEAALAGLDPDEGPGDGPLLLARANLAFFRGDLETAADTAAQARALLSLAQDSWEVLDLVALQGLIAHQRGEWYSRLETELRSSAHDSRVVAAVFDANLCVSEYLLYGPTPYPEVLRLAEEIRSSAERAGSLRAVAFAHALAGEAALLSGDLDRAEHALREALDLHAEAGARAGQALCLQRLAEVRLARGDRDGAQHLLDRALPLARWTPVAIHLIDRIHGTMIAAAPDPAAACEVVDMASNATDDRDQCWFCSVTFAVPAAIACADAGDLEHAREHLASAERSTALWPGTAWQAATVEARAHLEAAEGDPAAARRLLDQASRMFAQIGHPRDAERCARPLALGSTPADAESALASPSAT